MKKFTCLFIALLSLSIYSFAQCKDSKANKEDFRNATQLNVFFVYDGVTYDGDSETRFFKDQEFEVDNFEEWKKKWKGEFRTELWEKQFIKALAEKLYDRDITICYCPDAKYSMVIYINDIDPGNYAGPHIWSNPTKLTGSMLLVFTPENVYDITEEDWVFEPTTFEDFNGSIINQEAEKIIEYRVQASFGELGTMIGTVLRKYINKKAKQKN